MDMFEHYYPTIGTDVDIDYRQVEIDDNERQIIWAVKDFADACERFGFLHMGEELVAELKKRQERKQAA